MSIDKKSLIGGGGKQLITDLFKQADYWAQFDTFTYDSYSSRFYGSYYTLHNLECTAKSNNFMSPWDYWIRIEMRDSFDIPYSPNIWLYSANLSADKTYTSAMYIMDYVFTTHYLGETMSDTVNHSHIKGGTTGSSMTCSSSKPEYSYLTNIFDNIISKTYSEGTVVPVPILVGSWINGIPQEIIDYETAHTPPFS